jgi:hypothetical protein
MDENPPNAPIGRIPMKTMSAAMIDKGISPIHHPLRSQSCKRRRAARSQSKTTGRNSRKPAIPKLNLILLSGGLSGATEKWNEKLKEGLPKKNPSRNTARNPNGTLTIIRNRLNHQNSEREARLGRSSPFLKQVLMACAGPMISP